MSSRPISDTTVVVTGASRGFGRAISTAMVKAGAHVVGLATDRVPLEALADELGGGFTPVVADAADPFTAGRVIDTYTPTTLVLNAGASPLVRPLQQHTWETFSRAWEVDVKQSFHWLREALLRPLEPGSTVISMSSGAALGGSPLSGGYAGAKATVRFVSAYAQQQSAQNGLGIRFVSVLPKLTPATERGAANVAAYARYGGISVEAFLERLGPSVTTEQIGQGVLDLATDTGYDKLAYTLSPDGLNALN